MNYLKFGKGNGKLSKNTLTFALPAGHFCPFARECLSKTSRAGKLKDGKHTKFRCFGASLETVYKRLRERVWSNADLLKSVGLTNVRAMTDLIIESITPYIKKNIKYVRIHSTGGDFFNQHYTQAWYNTCKRFPEIQFYAYTKAIDNVRNARLSEVASITFSKGGTQDNRIELYGLKQAIVVNYVETAKQLGLEIDVDDSLARNPDFKESFALLIHGTQPKGSDEGKANYYNVKNKIKKQLIAAKG